MSNIGGHGTRSILVSRKSPDLILVQVGSNENIDNTTIYPSSGRSQARLFNATALTSGTSSVDYSTGTLFAWGLRNSIGWTEHPTTGGVVI